MDSADQDVKFSAVIDRLSCVQYLKA